jgi:transposase
LQESIEILAVLADHKRETAGALLRSMPVVLRRTIERACMDMYEGFMRAVEVEAPQAEIGIDRFQVARACHDCVDTVRKKERKRRKSALPTVEYAEIQGTMWPFRTQPVTLDPPE